MAKIKSFIDAYGVTHDECIWLPMFVAINHVQRTARIEFLGYHNIEALASGKQPLPGASKAYDISGEMYDTLTQTMVGGKQDKLINLVSQACYDNLTKIQDTPDPKDPKKMVSFWQDASDVTLPA